MEIKIYKWDIHFSLSRYWYWGYSKTKTDGITYRDISLGFLFIAFDTYHDDYLIY